MWWRAFMAAVYQNFTDDEKANYEVINNFIEASYFLLWDKNFSFEELAYCTYEDYLAKTVAQVPLNEGQFEGLQTMLKTMLGYLPINNTEE